jgi:16S rRNA (uracil1498-N3)-methyltransferase
MHVMRCYADPSAWTSEVVELGSDEAHHLRDVLRARPGQAVTLFDGRGREADGEVVEVDRRGARVRVLQQRSFPPAATAIALIQALPREQKMDIIIQKATELGAARIAPVITDHSLVRLEDRDLEAKRSRWEKIALNAAKQCGSPWLPEIRPPVPLSSWIRDMERPGLLLLASLQPDAEDLRTVLRRALPSRPASVAVLVGPEGDLSSREIASARNAGAVPVRLGRLTLRSETAALYALSVLRYELGDGPAV